MGALLWSNLRRKRLRLALTIASIAVAFILFALIMALQQAFRGGVNLAGEDRLMTMHKVSFVQPLPRSYLGRVRAQEGVRAALSLNWFGGYFRSEKQQIFSSAVLGEERLLEVFPELRIEPAQYRAWLRERNGALIGKDLAQAMGWQVGTVIPLRSAIYFKTDGSNTWDIKISGIFDNSNGDNNNLYFHYDYFNEALANKNFIGFISLRVTDKRQSPALAARIDALFANSNAETKTSTEKAAVKSFANQIGNISAIAGVIVAAVFFTLLLITANTMGQAIRERTREIGVLKTLGFTNAQVMRLVLAESVLITVLGGVLGMVLGSGFVRLIGAATKQYLPLLMLPPASYVLGAGLMLMLGVLSGMIPCWQAFNLKITEALRRS